MSRATQRNRRCARAAFTLMELLVASIIFIMLTGAIYSVFSAAMRMRERTYASIEMELPSSAAIETMRRDLTCMTVPTGFIAGPITGTPNRMMGASTDDLDMYTAIGSFREQDTDVAGEIQEVHYSLQPSANSNAPPGMELVREVYPFVLAQTPQTPITQRLLNGVQSLQIDYYDSKQMAWVDNWDSQTNASNTATNGTTNATGTAATGGIISASSTSTTDDGTSVDTLPGVTPQAVKVRIEFAAPSRNEQPKRPLVLVCEIPAQSLDSVTTETTTDDLSSVTGTTGATQ